MTRQHLPIVAVAVLGAVAAGVVFGTDGFRGDRPASEDVSAQPAVDGASQRTTISAAHASYPWASAKSATITQGVQTYIQGGQCTANFVFVDNAENVYLGQAAHRASTGGQHDTNGHTAGSRPLGTPVRFRRGVPPAGEGEVIGTGQLAYSSWLFIRSHGERDVNTCAYNDFALVKIDAKYVAQGQPQRAVPRRPG
jgi:hypothetical protein